ncbi:enoyl-CoA hydratase/isomerase family protein [Ramlibacter sp. RBP-2]|uniref:Enoyl-CoA hydratase/isomerase family protein n=1 Tax=Ramlibacter lithotrophicus TaxID=2606681 RepID=A0A7X6DKQ4_9BURK|nr:enoyl-CoA hydratase/isomerase family protein [Ramlibacter lithotrophicus]
MLNLEIEGALAVLTLKRAPANAINLEWLDAFEACLKRLEGEEAVAVLHLRSSERVFCAGADLHLLSASLASDAGVEAMMRVVGRMQQAYARLARLSQVTVAEIGGAALGGGLELCLACDLRIMADEATVGLPESRLGLLPGAGGTQRLTLIAGSAVASRLILGAETVKGQEARNLGLVQWSVSAHDLPQRAADLAASLARLPAAALAACKRCIAAAAPANQEGFRTEVAETRDLYRNESTRALIAEFLRARSSKN